MGNPYVKYRAKKDLYYGTEQAAGIDLICENVEIVNFNVYGCNTPVIKVNTCTSFEIPKKYYGQLVLRSSTIKKGLYLLNSVGIIDSDYRGDILAFLKSYIPEEPYNEEFWKNELLGKSILQLIITPYYRANLKRVNNLIPTKRDDKGFGSTGESGNLEHKYILYKNELSIKSRTLDINYETPELTMEDVIKITINTFKASYGLEEKDLVFNKTRKSDISNFKFIFTYFLNEFGVRNIDISRFLNTDHSTINHRLRKVENWIEIKDKITIKIIETLKQNLKESVENFLNDVLEEQNADKTLGEI